MALAIRVYRITSEGPIAKDWGLRDQMRRSAVSIPSNVAEGNERDSDRDACRFFFISKGSAGELATQAQIALEIGAVDLNAGESIINECDEIGRMLHALIQVRSGEKPSRASRLVSRASRLVSRASRLVPRA